MFAFRFKLQVEADDERWLSLLHSSSPHAAASPPCCCSVDDCRIFLLSIQRPDALAALLQVCTFGFGVSAVSSFRALCVV